MSAGGARVMSRRSLTLKTRIIALILAAAAAVLLLTPAKAADPARTGPPNSIASTGDSITRAFETGTLPFTDNPARSWSTGNDSAVNSFYRRILATNSAISGNNLNDARTGAKMTDLNGQVQTAVSQGAQFVTILMGANDVCTSSESTMTSVSTFRSQLQAAMATVTAGLPDARIYVVSIPNIYQLWSILHDNFWARSVWWTASICQSMLANPTSTAQADTDRRARVRQRNIDFNTQLQQVCALYVHCRFDNNAVFNTSFPSGDVSGWDYFHPNTAGQNLLASVAWGATFSFGDTTAPESSATRAAVTGGTNVTITATDNAGVRGIEYKIGSGTYTKYIGAVTVSSGSTITYRAVDINGNSEASHSITG